MGVLPIWGAIAWKAITPQILGGNRRDPNFSDCWQVVFSLFSFLGIALLNSTIIMVLLTLIFNLKYRLKENLVE
jgi:hypothetical protein